MANVAKPRARSLDEVLAGSGPRRSWVQVLSGPAAGQVLPVVSGSVTVDASAPIRRTADVTVAGLPEWEPRDATDALDVRAGTELQVWQGVTDDHGTEHEWSQGIFSPSHPSVTRDGSGLQITCALTDRAHRVKLAGAPRRWAASGTDRILASIVQVLGEVAPWLPIDIDTTGDIAFGTDAVPVEWGDDVWDACRSLALSMARDLHVDRDGVCVAPPITDPLTATPQDLHGLTATSVETDVEDVVNVVGCPWEEARPDDAPETWVPKGGVVEATDTSTSTGVGSPLGPRRRVFSGDASVVHTADHAALAAQADLSLRMGLVRAATGSVVPDPRLDVGIPVDVDGATHVVSRLTIGLEVGGDTGIDLGASRPEIAAMLAATLRPPGEYRTTEIVTGLAPLRSRSVTDPGGAEVTVIWTDALAGVEVGDPITVLHKGAGERVGVALLVKKALADKHGGESIGTVGGQDLSVGGDAPLRVRTSQGGTNSAYVNFSDGDVTVPIPASGVSESTFNNHRHRTTGYSLPSQPTEIAQASAVTLVTLNNTRNKINEVIGWIQTSRNAFITARDTGTPL